MTIIGVTDESASKIKNFLNKKDIKYLIAIGGAPDYRTSGIPHAWLVSPGGDIVWEGYPGPANLKDSLIEEQLTKARLRPEFRLPGHLRRAERYLNQGKFALGIKALERYLKKPRDDDTAEAARNAIGKARRYGKDRLKTAEELEKAREYLDAYAILKELETAFKGMETGKRTKEKLKIWKKDKQIRAELEGGAYLMKAEALIRKRKYRPAANLLMKIIKTKKYQGTRCREKAEKTFNRIRRYV